MAPPNQTSAKWQLLPCSSHQNPINEPTYFFTQAPQAQPLEVQGLQPTPPSAATQPVAPLVVPCGAYVPDPSPYFGELSKWCGFLFQCQVVLSQQPMAFTSDLYTIYIYYVMGRQYDQTWEWVLAYNFANPLTSLTFARFSSKISRVIIWIMQELLKNVCLDFANALVMLLSFQCSFTLWPLKLDGTTRPLGEYFTTS